MSEETQRLGSTTQTTEEVSLFDELLDAAKLKRNTEGFDVAEQGIKTVISQFTQALLEGSGKYKQIDKAAIDMMIADIDSRLSSQINEILHHKEFQKLESAWRGLKYLIDSVDFRENIKVEVLNCSKNQLREDFEDAPEVVQSGLYRKIYTSEFGVFGGNPIGVICSNYEFDAGAQDVPLLRNCAAVATMAHAPFLANAAPEFFGVESFEDLPKLKDLKSLFEAPQYARWQSFRESEDSRYVGLCVPRFLLRLPYGSETVPVKSFNFEENATGHHDRYLWGACSLAFAARVADSFAKYRWCPNIIGPQSGGAVENLPLHQYKADGEIKTKIPIECSITDRREFELAEEGLIPLVWRKGADNASFFSANSVQKAKIFADTEEGKSDELNYRLGTQLPYMFIVTRLAHYIKVLQREQIGSWKERADLERELNKWISQYVADMENPAPSVRSRKPLRQAKVEVFDVPGQPGWYRCGIKVRPHFKYSGASFELSLVGKLDKS